MKIYDDYLSTIKAAMSADRKSQSGFEGLVSSFDSFEKSSAYLNLYSPLLENKLLPSLGDFANEVGLKANFNQSLGLHPDFAHLKLTDRIEKHYIISVFIDIKGSTNLFAKYDPETVLIINNTIQRAAIHTCLIYGGYIHRLQGDGLFVYFGGKNINAKSAIVNALQSTSLISYFVKNDLKKLFSEQGIDNIYTRIGIDLGYDNDVVWAMAGIGEISEVTTCSLHTSLASKMQANAQNNGIVFGDNIKNNLDDTYRDLLSPVCHRTQNEGDRYIFKIPDDKFFYTQYDFNWLQFLKHQDFIALDVSGDLVYRSKKLVNTQRDVENLKPIASLNKPYFNGPI